MSDEPKSQMAPSETRCRSGNRDSDTERVICTVRIREHTHFGGVVTQKLYLLNVQSELFKYCGGGIQRGNSNPSTVIESTDDGGRADFYLKCLDQCLVV